MDNKTYWPFEPVPPQMRTGLQDLQVQLMEEATRRGFRAYIDGTAETGALFKGRWARIHRRGARNQFQIVLGSGDMTATSAMVEEFECAGFALLEWLRSGSAEEAGKYLAGHMVNATPRLLGKSPSVPPPGTPGGSAIAGQGDGQRGQK